MKVLSKAHTWFLESIKFKVDGSLCVELVEGIKSEKKELVQVDQHNTIGPYFSVSVTNSSKVVSVTFGNVLAYEVLNESYDVGDDKLEKEGDYLFKCSGSSYLEFVEKTSAITDFDEEYTHYLLWSEDFLVKVISCDQPVVLELDQKPNMEYERTITYAAN